MRQIVLLLIFVLYKPISCESDSSEKEKCDNIAAASASLCNEDLFVQYLAELEIINPESIVMMALINSENLCRNLYNHLEKIHKFLQTCKITNQHYLYMSLLSGAKTLHKKLCNTPEFSRRYELYYPCLHELRNDFSTCNGPVDWYEEKNEAKTCKSLKRITDCQYIKAAKVCGIDAAKTIKELTTDVVQSVISIKCDNTIDPVVKDPMPDSYICGKAEISLSSVKVITFLTFLRLYLI